MSLDSVLGLAGLAVGIAALVPIFVVKSVKHWLVAVLVVVFLVGLSGVLLYQRRVEDRHVDRLENEIKKLLSGNNPMTFEEIYDHLNYAQYGLVTRAIGELIDSDQIWAGRIDVKSSSGTTYTTRIYNNINFPVRSTFTAPNGTAPTAPNCPPSLPSYDSPTMDGGHTQEEICGPKRENYRKQFPGCEVTMAVSESVRKDWLGHASYQYSCNYAIKPK
jgi:hypothetical protein